MASFLYRLGHFSVRHRRSVVACWMALLVGTVFAGTTFGGSTSEKLSLPGTESQQAFDLLDSRFPAQGGSSTRVVFASGSESITSTVGRAAIDSVFTDLAQV